VLVEFHETIDVSEAERPGVTHYVKTLMGLLVRVASATVTHATSARDDVHRVFPATRSLPGAIILHGPSDTFDVVEPRAVEPDAPLRLLHFGVLRSYKGLEDLAGACRQLIEHGEAFHLTVAGEVWDEAADAVAALEGLGTFVTFERGYLPDERLAELLGDCDVVVLPYRRSVASGPLHTATAAGRTIVCSELDTLVEATSGYPGIVYARPSDPVDLARAIRAARALAGVRHEDPNSWERNVEAYLALLERARRRSSRGEDPARRHGV
jgi:glycosyltransferase involved in cell wall biosynthesis